VVSDSYLTFTEHLEELRWCLLRALAAVVVASLACYFFADAIFAVMVDPLKQILPPGQNLIGTTVTEAFFTEIKVSFLAGVLFSSPFVFYEVWRFIRPGLIGNESRLVIPFVLCATLFFLGGAYFCYRIVLPVAFSYFIEQYGTLGVTPAIRLGEYFTFFFSYGAGLRNHFRVADHHICSRPVGNLGSPLHATVLSLCGYCDIHTGCVFNTDAGYH
jgi:sec-independent protein translocase protein TatC